MFLDTERTRTRATGEISAPRIASLDGIRAVAILLVVIGHAWRGLPYAATGRLPWIITILGNQSLGVSIFFVLSGFLITTLLLREEEAHGAISLSGFYLRRAFRILPAFYTYLVVIGLVAFLCDWHIPSRDLLSAGTFTWNYMPGNESWLVAHSWSLCVEEQFYLLWPLVLRTLGRQRATWFASALIVLSPIVRIAMYFAFPALRPRIYVMLHTRVDILMFGCLLALLSQEGRIMSRLASLVAQRAVQFGVLLYLFVVSPLLSDRFQGKYTLTVGWSLEGACIAFFVFWAVRAPGSLVGRLLNVRWVMRLGVLSYSLYLWQQAFTGGTPNPLGRLFPLNVLAAWLAAECSYRFVEKPLLRLRDSLLRPKPAPAHTENAGPSFG